MIDLGSLFKLGLNAESEIKVEEEAHNGTRGCAEGRVLKRNAQKSTDPSAKDEIAAQAKEPGPPPYASPPKHFSF